MLNLDLAEYEQSRPYRLSAVDRDSLRAAIPSLTIEPAKGADAAYHITPSSTVGAVDIDNLSVLIRPKIGIPQLLSLACYAMGVYKPQEQRLFDFQEEPALPDTLALALTAAARRAFARGLLHGYRTEEEALYAVRGRIRFDEQIRRRFGIPMPVEVRYDEFTDDITENRLVKAAVARLGEMRLRSSQARRGLGWTAAMLENVSLVEYAQGDVPDVTFDRLNEHYRGVVGLSRLILEHSAFEAKRGKVRATGFLMDMNVLFQEFVTVALRESLGVSERVFLERSIPTLDVQGEVRLRPDLTWWDGNTCTFVGDAKYKRIESVPNADLYQLLAYVTALDLPGGLLVYAAGEAAEASYRVRKSGKTLEISTLNLEGSLESVLRRVCDVAAQVRELRDDALGLALPRNRIRTKSPILDGEVAAYA